MEEKTVIYTAGCCRDETGITNACYWEDGKMFNLHPVGAYWSYACSIAIDWGKVYAAGTFSDGKDSRACYWADGRKIDVPADGMETEAHSIDLADGKVFIAGTYTEKHVTKACYWTAPLNQPADVVRINLEAGSYESEARSIKSVDGKVYAGGTYTRDGMIKACYWVDGAKNDLPDFKGSDAFSIKLAGGKIFAAGYYHLENGGYSACYWVDGKMVDLPGPQSASAGAHAMAVSGDKVYVTGYFFNGNNQGCYWEDGKMVDLKGNYSARDIAVKDGKVYVAGFGSGKACYWIDGVKIELPGGVRGAKALSIAVV